MLKTLDTELGKDVLPLKERNCRKWINKIITKSTLKIRSVRLCLECARLPRGLFVELVFYCVTFVVDKKVVF
jgi:hypothetical protein